MCLLLYFRLSRYWFDSHVITVLLLLRYLVCSLFIHFRLMFGYYRSTLSSSLRPLVSWLSCCLLSDFCLCLIPLSSFLLYSKFYTFHLLLSLLLFLYLPVLLVVFVLFCYFLKFFFSFFSFYF